MSNYNQNQAYPQPAAAYPMEPQGGQMAPPPPVGYPGTEGKVEYGQAPAAAAAATQSRGDGFWKGCLQVWHRREGSCEMLEAAGLGASSRNIGYTTITGAELWGLFQGLHLAWNLGYRNVVADVDNQSVVKMVMGPAVESWGMHGPIVRAVMGPAVESWGMHGAIVRAIRELLIRDWHVSIAHCFREANFAADCLATLAHSCPNGCQRLIDSSIEVKPWLTHDVFGVAYSRNTTI